VSYTYELPDEEDFLYTLIQHIPKNESNKEIAILLTSATIEFHDTKEYSPKGWYRYWLDVDIQLPLKAFEYIQLITIPFPDSSVETEDELKEKLRLWIQELLPESAGFDIARINFVPKIQDSYKGWREEILLQLIGRGISNQAIFNSSSHPMCEYNGMKFRSKSEMALAKHFEESNVLFFPLPLANCRGEKKEPDYLVCKDGKWAILECVSDMYHPSIEREADRDIWFQNHNIEVRKYPATRCFNAPAEVVADFINWLDRKH